MEQIKGSYQDAICGALVAAMCYMKVRHVTPPKPRPICKAEPVGLYRFCLVILTMLLVIVSLLYITLLRFISKLKEDHHYSLLSLPCLQIAEMLWLLHASILYFYRCHRGCLSSQSGINPHLNYWH